MPSSDRRELCAWKRTDHNPNYSAASRRGLEYKKRPPVQGAFVCPRGDLNSHSLAAIRPST